MRLRRINLPEAGKPAKYRRVKLFDLWVQRMTLRLVTGVSQGAAKANESGSKDRIAGYGESDMARRYLNAS